MRKESVIPRESDPAFLAFERCLPRVGAHVTLQTAAPSERLATLQTDVRLFACVGTFMAVEVGLLCETFVANLTRKRFFAGVRAHVVHEFRVLFVNFVTKFAREFGFGGFLGVVNVFEVASEVGFLSEFSSAEITFVRFLTSVNSHAEIDES